MAISLDGTQIVYSANNRLFVRHLGQFDARPLQGTEGDSREPVFSPDGRSIAFYSVAEQSIKRVAISGGAPVVISRAEEPSGMSWGSDGIVFGQPTTGIMRVRPEGGSPEAIVRVKDGQAASSPRMLPGGTHMLFTLASGAAPDRWERARLIVQSLTSGEQRTLIEGASDGWYVPTGHIVYALSGRLFAVRFDLARLAVIGDPIPIVDGIRRSSGSATASGIIVTPGIRLPTNPGAGEADFSISNTGTLVYIAGPSIAAGSALVEIVLMDKS